MNYLSKFKYSLFSVYSLNTNFFLTPETFEEAWHCQIFFQYFNILDQVMPQGGVHLEHLLESKVKENPSPTFHCIIGSLREACQPRHAIFSFSMRYTLERKKLVPVVLTWEPQSFLSGRNATGTEFIFGNWQNWIYFAHRPRHTLESSTNNVQHKVRLQVRPS